MPDIHNPKAPTPNDIRTEWEKDRLKALKFLEGAHPQLRDDLLANWTPPPTNSFLPERAELRRHKERGAA